MPTITVSALVHAPLATVWEAWTSPQHIVRWNAASDDWHTPRATVDLKAGGRFCSRMEARDGSMGFDFEGEFLEVREPAGLRYRMDDGREVSVTFAAEVGGVRVTEVFDAEDVHPEDLQRAGWQAILDRFKAHAEGLA